MKDKTINFLEAKAERDGTITPLAVAESIVEYLKNPANPTLTHFAIVAKDAGGVINTAHSTMNYLELVGLHATAQALALEDMDA